MLHALKNNLQEAIDSLGKRGFQFDHKLFEQLTQHRSILLTETQALQSKRNQLAKEIAMKKKEGVSCDDLMSLSKEVNIALETHKTKTMDIEDKFKTFLSEVPNIPHESVPSGSCEEDNVEVRTWGNPRTDVTKDHVEIGASFGIDIEKGVAMSGARFSVLTGVMAQLHRALAQFIIDTAYQVAWLYGMLCTLYG